MYESNIDIAFRVGKLPDSSLVQKKVAQISLVYMASSKYLKLNSKIYKLSDLSNHKVATLKTLKGILTSKLTFDQNAIVFSSNSASCLKKLALKGSAIVTLPKSLCYEEIKSSELVDVLPGESFFKAPLYILSNSTRYTANHVKEFKEYVANNISTYFK